MTKAAVCTSCMDIVAPRRDWRKDRSWRWCECEHTGVRWRHGERGLLEVTSRDGIEGVRVLGLNNLFLVPAAGNGVNWQDAQWRTVHEVTCEDAGEHYLFGAGRRNCWALVIAVGQTGDVTFISYRPDMRGTSVPASSTDRATAS